MDLAERLEALSSRNDEPLPTGVPAYTDDEAKDVFLTALEDGKTIPEAAALTGRTATWFRRRRNPSSRNYDAAFSNHYDEVMAADGPNREALALRAFTALVKAADSGNVRAVEKILAAYHADFGFLRPAIMQGDVNIDKLIQIMPGVSTETLVAMREELLQARQAALPVIDA